MWQFHNLFLAIIKYSKCLITVLCMLCLLFIGHSLFFTRRENERLNCSFTRIEKSESNDLKPVVNVFGIKEGEKTLTIVEHTFRNLGYEVQTNSANNWDFLWSYTYPFHVLSKELSSLKPYQKVNHFPGSGFITQKSNLASLSLDHIPKSFMLPAEKERYIKYAQMNKDKSWLMKSSTHRGMKLINITENLEINKVFIQEFIEDPLLINGKKFDIGVYVMLTSIDPLRVYIYYEDVLLRFCNKDYYPLNLSLPDSYIVGDDYLPIWEVPDLKFYFSELNYTAKESLNAYLQSQGKSVKKLWHQIYETIQNVYLKTEDSLKQSIAMFSNKRNFFELVRFDFLADKDLNVFLLEVNMSPNLSPAHFPQNNLLYEQIVFNSLSLVGLIRKFPTALHYSGETEVSEKDIHVLSEQCSSQICQLSCRAVKCKVCNQCMNEEYKEIAKAAYLEFTNRGKYRRLLPPPLMADDLNRQDKKIEKLSPMNAFMHTWFQGKCLQDIAWCF